MTEEEAEQSFNYEPTLNYEILKQFFYLDSPDSLAYSNLILNSDTKEETQPKLDKYHSETTQKQLYFIGSNSDFDVKTEMETETETKIMSEDEAHEEKILVGTRDEQLFRHDSSIKYEPLKRYIVPRFAFYDSSSTDWSDSSPSSDSESEDETMAKAEAQSQEEKIIARFNEKHVFHDDLVS